MKDALIYAFPTLETELQLMQAALKKFFDSEKGIHIICELPENDLQNSLAKKRDVEVSPLQEQKNGLRNWKASSTRPSSRMTSRTTSRAPSRTGSRAGSRPSSRASSCAREGSVDFNGGGLMTTWSLESGRELDRKKKSPYDPVKRRKVAENRGNACDRHRAAKSACDPLTCPQNKMFGKLPVTDNALSEPQAMRPRRSRDNVLVFESSVQNANSVTDRSITMLGDMSNTPQGDLVGVPPDADVFWDLAEPGNMNDAMLNIGQLSTSSYAGSWTDGSFTDLMSWSPNSSCLTAPDSTRGSLTGLPELPQQDPLMGHFDATQEQADLCNAPLPIPHTCPLQQYPSLSYPSPSDEPSAQQPLAAPALMDRTLTYSEDPFMGWASKKANQMIDDYGWVLSHVETL